MLERPSATEWKATSWCYVPLSLLLSSPFLHLPNGYYNVFGQAQPASLYFSEGYGLIVKNRICPTEKPPYDPEAGGEMQRHTVDGAQSAPQLWNVSSTAWVKEPTIQSDVSISHLSLVRLWAVTEQISAQSHPGQMSNQCQTDVTPHKLNKWQSLHTWSSYFLPLKACNSKRNRLKVTPMTTRQKKTVWGLECNLQKVLKGEILLCSDLNSAAIGFVLITATCLAVLLFG